MYQAKETGRNLYQFYSPDMNERAFERLFLDSDLHRALARNELELYFQPQIDLEEGHVVGAEALLRWNHATKGQISPVVFIPVAEEVGSDFGYRWMGYRRSLPPRTTMV